MEFWCTSSLSTYCLFLLCIWFTVHTSLLFLWTHWHSVENLCLLPQCKRANVYSCALFWSVGQKWGMGTLVHPTCWGPYKAVSTCQNPPKLLLLLVPQCLLLSFFFGRSHNKHLSKGLSEPNLSEVIWIIIRGTWNCYCLSFFNA